MLTVGCHLSTSKGFAAMGRTALSLGANTFAFFTRNPRGGAAKTIDPVDVAALRDLVAANGFGKLVAHAPYALNPCSDKDRHEKIGQGTLGLSTFEAVVTNPRLCGLPMILETPNELDGYAQEITLLRGLARGDGKD